MTDETTTPKIGYLTDDEGNKSSKRLFGAILLGIGIALGLTLFTFDMLNKDTSFNASHNVFSTFLMLGVTLLGLGTVEHFKNIFKK